MSDKSSAGVRQETLCEAIKDLGSAADRLASIGFGETADHLRSRALRLEANAYRDDSDLWDLLRRAGVAFVLKNWHTLPEPSAGMNYGPTGDSSLLRLGFEIDLGAHKLREWARSWDPGDPMKITCPTCAAGADALCSEDGRLKPAPDTVPIHPARRAAVCL